MASCIPRLRLNQACPRDGSLRGLQGFQRSHEEAIVTIRAATQSRPNAGADGSAKQHAGFARRRTGLALGRKPLALCSALAQRRGETLKAPTRRPTEPPPQARASPARGPLSTQGSPRGDRAAGRSPGAGGGPGLADLPPAYAPELARCARRGEQKGRQLLDQKEGTMARGTAREHENKC